MSAAPPVPAPACGPTRSRVCGPTVNRTFGSLEVQAFRLLLAGWLAAGTGAWVQRIAQDWLVLTLTDSPVAVGVATTCQFLPTLLLGLHGGALADALPRRRILMFSQVAMGLIATVLAALTATGRVEVWHVYGLALTLGVVNAVDNPARQSFLVETVGTSRLRNAISLLSLTFQVGALVGPLLSGVLIVTAGTEYAFAVTAVTYLVPLTLLAYLRPPDPDVSTDHARARVRDGVRYALRTPAVLWPSLIVGSFAFFTLNLPVTLATFAKHEFESGPTGVGLLSAGLALGSLLGALTTARRSQPLRLRTIAGSAAILTITLLIAAFAPTQATLACLLVPVGAANLALLTAAQSMVQLASADVVRGRVAGLYLCFFIGSGALGSPVVGLVAEHLGANNALLASGAVPAVITALIARHLAHRAHVRIGLITVSLQIQRPTLVPRT